MKKMFLCLIAGLLVSGVAFADSLDVNATAAMNSSSFGLEVLHDNTSIAFVEDTTPDNESIYRCEFLFNPNNISPGTGNLRQTIALGLTDNPNPGLGDCPVNPAAIIASFRIFAYFTGGQGLNYNVQAFTRGNQCGETFVTRIPIAQDAASKICFEMETGSGGSGRMALAVVGETESCAGASYNEANLSNNLVDVDRIRMGTPQTNNFGVGENGSMYFDEFASFRTLAAP